MRKPRTLAAVALAFAALALFVAGPIMIYEGVHGQSQIRQELTAQKVSFGAADTLPANLKSYANQKVTTGPQAKAYADLIETHIKATTGGKTYSEVSEEWIAGGRTDANLAQQRQTAFMGESLRASLMSAYQAWQVTWLVIGLGALFIGLGGVFTITAYALKPERIKVPESPEVLKHKETAAA